MAEKTSRSKRSATAKHNSKVKRARAAVKRAGRKKSDGFPRVLTAALMLAIMVYVVYRVSLSDGGETGNRISALPEQAEADYPYDVAGFQKSRGRMYYDDMAFATETGIDVSSYQEEIDWPRVADDGISFAILRIGYRGYGNGELYADDRFLENLKGAENAGLKTGVYFFSQAITEDEARDEARYTIELLNGAMPELPIYCDWEYVLQEDSRSAGTDGAIVGACCKAFCKELENAGYEAGVYMSSYLLDTMVPAEALAGLPVWMAEYSNAPICTTDYQIWQYSNSGEIDGIGVPVDLDLRFLPVE